jgi:hypothetical protein
MEFGCFYPFFVVNFAFSRLDQTVDSSNPNPTIFGFVESESMKNVDSDSIGEYESISRFVESEFWPSLFGRPYCVGLVR